MEWISKIELPKVKKEPNGRLAVQQRFKIAMEFLAPLGKLLQSTYSTRKRGKSAMGRAMSKVLCGAIEGAYPNQYVNPAKVLLSEGTLMSAREIALKRDGNTLTATFNARSDYIFGNPDDGVLLCAYSPSLRIAGINEEPAIRADGKVSITLPPQLKDQEVLVYILFRTRDWKHFSRSVYLGEW
uniref:Uncharacterized protein n=1 Tax=Sphingobacterium sp. (strain 21) TaxID=743722 RepID=F4C8U5_SPHS2